MPILLLFLFLGCAHEQHFDDVQKWSAAFDDPNRASWQKPEQIIKLLDIKPDENVAEIGAGTGFMLPYLVRTPAELIYALDVEPKLIAHMKERVAESRYSNVVVAQIPFEDPQLQDKQIHKALLINTWHHIADRPAYARLLGSQLMSGGQLLIVESEPDAGGPGPSHRLPMFKVIEDFKTSRLRCSKELENLPFHYIVRCSKPAQ